MITQDMLLDVLRFRARKARFDNLRAEILALVEDGAEIEPGNLDLDVRRSIQTRIRKEFLIEQLGMEMVEELEDLVEPTVYRRLIVVDRECK